MRKQCRKRVLSGILAVLMVLGCAPVPALAADTDGLCPHHPQHTEECGYRAAVVGKTCGHEHTDTCYAPVTQCVHVHGDCGYVAAVGGRGCECQPDENGQIVHEEGCGFVEAVEGVPCDHVCSEESGCITMALHCHHTHDDTCGFVAEQPEVPCAFVCEPCAKEAADRQAAEAVGALLEALPTVEELEAIPSERQAEAFEQIQKAYNAYNALTEAQKAMLSGAEETFAALFDCMEALTEPAPTGPASTEPAPTEPDPSEPALAEPLQEEDARIVPVPTAPAVSGICGDGLTWELEESGTLRIQGRGEMYDFSRAPWYDLRSEITSVELPEGITSIGNNAFTDCYQLFAVNGETSAIESIGDYAFYGCKKLEWLYLSESAALGSIGAYAFGNCGSWFELIVPAAVTFIGEGAFSGCWKLRSIVFHGNAPEIAADAFLDVTATVHYDGAFPSWTEDTLLQYGGTLSWNPFRKNTSGTCGDDAQWFFDEETGCLTITGTGEIHGNSSVHSCVGTGVEHCSPWYFFRERITSAVIESGITKIDYCTFEGCKSLRSVEIPESVTSLGTDAFYGCASLQTVALPSGLEKIGNSAFSDCDRLEALTISYGVTEIGNHAFYRCTNLKELTIPDSVTGIGDNAFGFCTSLTTISIPDSVHSIGRLAFGDCANLQSVRLPAGLPEIPGYAFTFCTQLSDVTLPEFVGKIGEAAFQRCEALKEIHIPDTVEAIDSYAFNGSGLRKICFYGKAPAIGEAAFGSVSATAYYPREEAGWTEEVFQNYGGGITWVPYADGHIHDFSTSHSCECGLIGGALDERVSWRFEPESGTLTISGSGWTPWQDSISDIDWWNCPELLNPRTDVRHVVVEKGITGLGAQTLSDLEALETVNLPEGLLELDYRCFGAGGNRMTQLTLPGTLETLGNWALWNLNLRELVIPKGVSNVYRNAFPRTIEKLTFLGDAPIQTERVYTGPDSWYTRIVPFLEGYAASVYYPAENDTWDWDTRRSLGGSITWVGVGKNGTTVDGDCGDSLRWTLRDGILEFSGYGEMTDYSRQTPAPWHPFADSIREVRLGGCYRIGAYAFAELTALESVTIPESVNVIGKMAFGDCTGLCKITFSGSVPYSISDTAFTGVRAFAHYTIGNYNTSVENRLKDYGGTLIWVEHGEIPKMLTIELYQDSFEVGEAHTLTVTAHPYNATADCEYSLNREGIISVRQSSFRKLTFQAIAPGEVTVTARDKTTGLTASATIRVMDAPRVIGCPFQESLVIDRIPFQRDYQFTPEKTGYYALLYPYSDWESNISVTEGENYLNPSGFQNQDGIGCAVYFLTKGKSYRISCWCGNEALLGTAGPFRLREAAERIASISFAQDERCFTIEQNQEGVSEGWAEIQARLYPMEAYAPIQWTLNNSYFAEIEETYGSYCYLKLKHPGSVVLTASCGGQFASMRIVIQESGDILDLELDEPMEVALYDGEHSGLLRFRAPQDGWYAFQREGDGDFGNWFSFVNEGGQGQSAGIRHLNRGETVTMRLIPTLEGETGTARVWVTYADPSPRAMEVVCVENRQGGVSFRANFQPLNAFRENISWSVSKPELLGRSRYDGSPYDNRISLTPYGHGEVTVTATTENGLTASCTVTVGACFAGHDWRTEVIEPGCEIGGFTVARCFFCGEIAISDRLPAMGHTPVIDPAVEPTCHEDGKTEGQHCAVCETILVPQESIPGGHRFEEGICVRCQEPEFPPEIRILPAAVTELVSGQKQQLTAWRWPEERRVNVTWSLAPGDEAYGEISQKGILTAKQVPGVRLVTVKAVTDSGDQGSKTFRILPKTTALFITVDGSVADGIQTVDLLERNTIPLSVQAEPVGAGNGVRWSSSATSVASVDAQGMVTLKKPGTAVVTATALDGSKVSAKLALRVIYADPAKKLTAVSDAPSEGLLPGERAQVTLAGEEPIPAELVAFSIPAREQEIATIDDHGVVTAGNRAGTVTVTAALKGDPLGRKATVKVPVFVRDYAPRLESGKLTLNGYASRGTPIDLRASYGNEIEELTLLNRTEQFRLEDNTLHSIGLLKNGTYPLGLQARCRNGETYTYSLQVKVSNTLPTVMVKQSGKLNLFYLDSAVNLSIIASGQRITDVQMTGTDDFELDYDSENGIGTLRRKWTDGVKPNTKAVLQVSVAGYTEPVSKSFTISTTTAVPRLGVSPASSTINTALRPEDLSTEVKLRNASTGEALELESVTCTSNFVEVSGAGDTLTLTLKGKTGGTAEIYVKEENWTRPLKLTHKITVTDKAPTLTLGTRTLKLNTRFPGVAAQTTVGLSQRNLELAGVELTCTNPEAEKLSVYCQDGKILAEFRGEALPKPGTYIYTCVGALVDGMGTVSGGTVRVTVTDAQPKVTLSPKGKLDTLNPDSGILYTPKLTNCLGALTDAELDDAFCTQFDTEVVDGRISLKLRQGVAYQTGAPYKVRFRLTVGGEVLLSPVVSVRVSQSAAKVRALPSSLSLFLSQSAPLTGQLNISLGAIGEVAISQKTSPELRAAMGEPQVDPCGATVSFRLPITDTSPLTAGKSYALYLDVTPENSAENVDPIRIKLTVKVMK